jgi:hypothetical protein
VKFIGYSGLTMTLSGMVIVVSDEESERESETELFSLF